MYIKHFKGVLALISANILHETIKSRVPDGVITPFKSEPHCSHECTSH